MAKTFINRQLVGGNQIKNDYKKINLNSDELNQDLIDLYAQDETLQSNIDTEEQNRIAADDVLDTRIDNIIAQSGTSDTEVVDARQSTYYGETFTVLDNRLENVENKKAEETMITNSFHADPVKYYGNVKTIDDFQDVSEWTSVTGTQSLDSANTKIGSYSLKILENDALAGSLFSTKNNLNLDLTKLNNRELSGDSDYINVVLYISNINAINLSTGVTLAFSQDPTYSNTNIKLISITTGLTTGWNYIKIKKSTAITLEGGAWSGIQSLKILWSSNAGYQNAYVSFQLIQLVKADPVAQAYPNPFQEDFTINSGEWFVGMEFGKIIIKELKGVETINAIESKFQYSDFIINSIKKVQNNTGVDRYVGWEKDADNLVAVYFTSNNLKLLIKENAINTVVSSDLTTPIVNGDILNYTLIKKGQRIELNVNINGGNPIKISGTTSVDSGALILGNDTAGRETLFTSISITEIAHAHHADIAEVAKGLTEQARCEVTNSEFFSIPNNVTTDIAFNTAISDEYSMFNGSTGIVINEIGLYYISLNVEFRVSVSTGKRLLLIKKNGIVVKTIGMSGISGSFEQMDIFKLTKLNSSDVISCSAFQDSGGAVSLSKDAILLNFSVTKIR